MSYYAFFNGCLGAHEFLETLFYHRNNLLSLAAVNEDSIFLFLCFLYENRIFKKPAIHFRVGM